MAEQTVFDKENISEYFCGMAAWELETGVLLVADSLKTAQGEVLLDENQRWGMLYLIQEGAFHWEEPFRKGTESIRPDKYGRRITLTDNEGFTKYDYFKWGMDTLHSTEAYLRSLSALHGGRIEKLSRETVLQDKTVFYVRPASFVAWAHSAGFQISEHIQRGFPMENRPSEEAGKNGGGKGPFGVNGLGSRPESDEEFRKDEEGCQKSTRQGQCLQGKQAKEAASCSAENTDDTPNEQTENLMQYDNVHRQWNIVFHGCELASMKNLEGLWYLSQILSHPRKLISAHELLQARHGKTIPASKGVDIVTVKAARAYMQRISELESAIEEERRDDNHVLVEQHKHELEQIQTQLSRVIGRDGKPRSQDPELERSRKSVCNNVKNAIRNIERVSKELSAYLHRTITLGYMISYIPEDDTSFEIIF